MNNNPIGILDSGVGGLSITSSLIKKLPKESCIFIADSKNAPYGNRTQEEIYKLSKKLIEFLLANKAKLIVVACNTITVSAIDKLRHDFPKVPIVGIVPVVKTAVEKTKSKKIGIFSTLVTSESDYQKDLIKNFGQDCSVLNLGSSTLVPLIENLNFEDIEKVLEFELKPFKKAKIDTLALGCTHFPLIKRRIQRYLPKVLILDSSKAIASQVDRVLDKQKLKLKSNIPSYYFYTTGDLKTMEYFLDELTSKAIIERISI